MDNEARRSILSALTTLTQAALAAGSDHAHAPGSEDQGWTDFRDQCRRQMQRPVDARIRYGFCRMYKPVLDDVPWRMFESMAAYRAWCAANLPAYLGFRPGAK
jgi:hypothetical protein